MKNVKLYKGAQALTLTIGQIANLAEVIATAMYSAPKKDFRPTADLLAELLSEHAEQTSLFEDDLEDFLAERAQPANDNTALPVIAVAEPREGVR